jgi:hypothetical protein
MPCGYFTPDEQPRTANQITIHALDRMVKFDNSVPGLLPLENENHENITDEQDQPSYFVADISYPATVQSIIQTVCGYYNVPFTQDISGFPNYNFTISEAPNLRQPTTYRNIIQWCAGIMGTCAWINWTGSLRFSWYGEATGYVCTPSNRFSSDLHEDDVEITGVQYTNLQNYTILAGQPDYTIDMTGNYLMAGGVTQILTSVNDALNGYTYRPFSASIINAPYLWPMDAITFTDKDGNDHTCVLTNVNFGINGAMAIEGKGESMAAARRDALSGMTKEQGVIVEQAREATQQLDDSLTQEEIFNRLTDNGAAQGLVLYNGELYINASYINAGYMSANHIQGGTLTLGGANNVDGVLEVYDSNGTKVGYWDNTGIHVVNGEISANALKGGIIDGDYVSAKQLNILNDSNGIIAKFDDKIILGDCDFNKPSVYWGTRAEIDNEGIHLFAESNREMFTAGSIENGNDIVDVFVTTETEEWYTLSKKGVATISSITVNGEGNWDYEKARRPPGVGVVSDRVMVYKIDEIEVDNGDGTVSIVEETIYPEVGDIVQITYTTDYPMYFYTFGQRATGSNPGEWSISGGENCSSNGNYSYTQGRNLISNGRSQHVFGEYNVADTTNTNANIRGAYVEIVGNGLSGNNRSNARTLDWSGNEWIAGALSVGDAATTLANLGAQTDVGFYIDAQGYICQRISSD